MQAEYIDLKKTYFIHTSVFRDYAFSVIRLCHQQRLGSKQDPSLCGFSHCSFLSPLHKACCYNTGEIPESLTLGQLSDSCMWYKLYVHRMKKANMI